MSTIETLFGRRIVCRSCSDDHAVAGLIDGSIISTDSRVSINGNNEILPVLFVHDELLSAPFFGHCLAFEFVQLFGEADLSPSGYFKPTTIGPNVHSPIVMSVNELERFYSLEGAHSLIDFLAEYSISYPDRIESFGDFIGSKGLQSRSDHLLIETFIQAKAETAKRMLQRS